MHWSLCIIVVTGFSNKNLLVPTDTQFRYYSAAVYRLEELSTYKRGWKKVYYPTCSVEKG